MGILDLNDENAVCVHDVVWTIYSSEGKFVAIDMESEKGGTSEDNCDCVLWCTDCGMLRVKGHWYPDNFMEDEKGTNTVGVLAKFLKIASQAVEKMQYDDTNAEEAKALGTVVKMLQNCASILENIFEDSETVPVPQSKKIDLPN